MQIRGPLTIQPQPIIADSPSGESQHEATRYQEIVPLKEFDSPEKKRFGGGWKSFGENLNDCCNRSRPGYLAFDRCFMPGLAGGWEGHNSLFVKSGFVKPVQERLEIRGAR